MMNSVNFFKNSLLTSAKYLCTCLCFFSQKVDISFEKSKIITLTCKAHSDRPFLYFLAITCFSPNSDLLCDQCLLIFYIIITRVGNSLIGFFWENRSFFFKKVRFARKKQAIRYFLRFTHDRSFLRATRAIRSHSLFNMSDFENERVITC